MAGSYVQKSEKSSSFAQTCNLLSQYVKTRGNLPGISSLGMGTTAASRPPAKTLNLLPGVENSSADETAPRESSTDAPNMKPMGLFPQFAEGNKSDNIPAGGGGSTAAPMTIFYAGQVIVFNEFPANKAKEIMDLLATTSKGTANLSTATTAPTSSVTVPDSTTNNDNIHPLRPQANNGSDLPIARRASLHRFFEKRKDRIAARVPYQWHSPSPVASKSRPEESINNPWLDLEIQSSKHLELRL